MRLTRPNARQEDKARREHILNILLLGTIFLSCMAVICASITYAYALSQGLPYGGIPIKMLVTVVLLFAMLFWFSKKGWAQFAAQCMAGLYFLLATYTSYTWGADVPQALLIFALVTVLSGILLGTRYAFLFTFFTALVLLSLTHLQANGFISMHASWKQTPVNMPDSLVSVVTLLLLATISWLYNREIRASLQKAYHSEKALKEERDSLEQKVEMRTQQLKEIQLEKMMQLYRFAEFGRIASGLFHDLTAPITAMSLNLELLEHNLETKQKTTALQKSMAKAKLNILRIEEFVQAARKQIQKQDTKERFSLNQEIYYVKQVLEYKARQLHVSLEFKELEPEIILYGNPLKMNQVLTNLISNAIDAYQDVKRTRPFEVHIHITQNAQQVKVLIQDWGSGIPEDIQSQIFKPLFTTKSKEHGMGIGLSISQNIIQEDFAGSIHFRSQEGKGSLFTILIPYRTKKI